MTKDNDTSVFTGMFIGAIFGLIVGQIIAGCLGMKGFTIPIICMIIGAILPLLSKE